MDKNNVFDRIKACISNIRDTNIMKKILLGLALIIPTFASAMAPNLTTLSAFTSGQIETPNFSNVFDSLLNAFTPAPLTPMQSLQHMFAKQEMAAWQREMDLEMKRFEKYQPVAQVPARNYSSSSYTQPMPSSSRAAQRSFNKLSEQNSTLTQLAKNQKKVLDLQSNLISEQDQQIGFLKNSGKNAVKPVTPADIATAYQKSGNTEKASTIAKLLDGNPTFAAQALLAIRKKVGDKDLAQSIVQLVNPQDGFNMGLGALLKVTQILNGTAETEKALKPLVKNLQNLIVEHDNKYVINGSNPLLSQQQTTALSQRRQEMDIKWAQWWGFGKGMFVCAGYAALVTTGWLTNPLEFLKGLSKSKKASSLRVATRPTR